MLAIPDVGVTVIGVRRAQEIFSRKLHRIELCSICRDCR